MELAHMIVVRRGWCWEEENIGILDLRDLIWANIWSVVAFVEESFTEYILDLEAMFELWIYFIVSWQTMVKILCWNKDR